MFLVPTRQNEIFRIFYLHHAGKYVRSLVRILVDDVAYSKLNNNLFSYIVLIDVIIHCSDGVLHKWKALNDRALWNCEFEEKKKLWAKYVKKYLHSDNSNNL